MERISNVDILLKYVLPFLLFVFLVSMAFQKRRNSYLERCKDGTDETLERADDVWFLFLDLKVKEAFIWSVKGVTLSVKAFFPRGLIFAFILTLMLILGDASKYGFESLFHLNHAWDYSSLYETRFVFSNGQFGGMIPWRLFVSELTRPPEFNLFYDFLYRGMSLIFVGGAIAFLYMSRRNPFRKEDDSQTDFRWILRYAAILFAGIFVSGIIEGVTARNIAIPPNFSMKSYTFVAITSIFSAPLFMTTGLMIGEFLGSRSRFEIGAFFEKAQVNFKAMLTNILVIFCFPWILSTILFFILPLFGTGLNGPMFSKAESIAFRLFFFTFFPIPLFIVFENKNFREAVVSVLRFLKKEPVCFITAFLALNVLRIIPFSLRYLMIFNIENFFHYPHLWAFPFIDFSCGIVTVTYYYLFFRDNMKSEQAGDIAGL